MLFIQSGLCFDVLKLAPASRAIPLIASATNALVHSASTVCFDSALGICSMINHIMNMLANNKAVYLVSIPSRKLMAAPKKAMITSIPKKYCRAASRE